MLDNFLDYLKYSNVQNYFNKNNFIYIKIIKFLY